MKAALEQHRGCMDHAAKPLGISRKGLDLKRQRLGCSENLRSARLSEWLCDPRRHEANQATCFRSLRRVALRILQVLD